VTLEEPPDETLLRLRVRRIRELRVETGRLREDAPPVTEDVEARLALIRARAAGPDPTERQVGNASRSFATTFGICDVSVVGLTVSVSIGFDPLRLG
jgi:hypothetical protein